ncbi:hypothetical protein ACT7C1_06560 [Bacillus paranthracis]|nr:hypothetical protein [Bacillus thuringiensis]
MKENPQFVELIHNDSGNLFEIKVGDISFSKDGMKIVDDYKITAGIIKGEQL